MPIPRATDSNPAPATISAFEIPATIKSSADLEKLIKDQASLAGFYADHGAPLTAARILDDLAAMVRKIGNARKAAIEAAMGQETQR